MENLEFIIPLLSALSSGAIGYYVRIYEVKKNETKLADKKFDKYSKRMWASLKNLKFRLLYIQEQIIDTSKIQSIPNGKFSVEWCTKDGHFAVSTLYLFTYMSCIVNLYQKEVDFINFNSKSKTYQFYLLLENLKKVITTNSVMWFHYFNGIGDYITNKKENEPITFNEFVIKLKQDIDFFEFMNQSFYFIQFLFDTNTSSKYIKSINSEISNLLCFIENNAIIPKIKYIEN